MLGAALIWSSPDGCSRVDWMINGMIKGAFDPGSNWAEEGEPTAGRHQTVEDDVQAIA
jgi:hypothetical protein